MYWIQPGEAFWRDTHYGEINAVKPDGAADHRFVARELVLPEIVAKTTTGVAPGNLALFRTEAAPERGFDA